MKLWKAKLHIVSQEFFQYSLFTYLILTLGELAREGFATGLINITILLIIVIFSGFIMALTYTKEIPKEKYQTKFSHHIQNSFVFAIIGAMFIYYKSSELGVVAYYITFTMLALIMLFSILLYSDEE